MGELLPCPFCGKYGLDQWPCEWLDATGANVVRCPWCHGAAPLRIWNCRASPQPSAEAAQDAKEIDRLRHSRDFYARRCEALQAIQSKMRDPERKAVCDILANGETYAMSEPAPVPAGAVSDDPYLVKLAAMLQALEFEPAAVNLSAAILSAACTVITRKAKSAPAGAVSDDEADALRNVYEAARSYLRFEAEPDKARKTREALDDAIEVVKEMDGGNYAPAQAVSVPDQLFASMVPHPMYAAGWNACREAMLSTSPPQQEKE